MSNLDCCICPDAEQFASRFAAKSLSQRDSAEQVRMLFGCDGQRSGTVDAARLRHCYRHLAQNFSLPCVAWYPEPTDENGGYPCTVTELIDPATGLGDKFRGIFCKVRTGKQEISLPLVELELSPDDPNYRLVQCCWDCFWHWR